MLLKSSKNMMGDCAVWINTLFEKNDPWDPELYDMVIPADKKGVDAIAAPYLKGERGTKM